MVTLSSCLIRQIISFLDHYLWGDVKDKSYADKPETIDVSKDNICEAMGEIQLHTINNVFKNWTDREGYCILSIVCSCISPMA